VEPPRTDPALIERLRADLENARYDVGHLADVFGPMAVAALERENRLPAVLAARTSDDPAATLARLLTLGDEVPHALAQAALPGLGVAGAAELGIVVSDGETVRAVVDLRPTEIGGRTWWLASDQDSTTTSRPVDPDHVLGLGGASRTLAELTVRTPVARALDLGTGCGVQALTLTAHAEAVTATDISARALAYARFNAALNGTEIDWRQGSMLEPVAGEQYDLVVSNPPFVITPRSGELATYTYRDGGRSGDDLVRDLITTVGSVLAPGGLVQMLGNWEIGRGERWTERVRAWLEASGLDGWVIQREVLDPAHYAETWLRDGGISLDRDRAAWEEAAEAWIADFAARRVAGIGFGYVMLRKPRSEGGARAHRLEELDGPVGPALGEHVAESMRVMDVLAGLDDDAVLDLAPVVAPDVTEERHHLPGEGDPSVILLRQGGGMGRVVRADTLLAAVVGACDGDLTLGQITGGVAVLLDAPVGEVRSSVLPAVRELLVDGQLTLPEPVTVSP
jgi:methylase of polypeptide subunit release factors